MNVQIELLGDVPVALVPSDAKENNLNFTPPDDDGTEGTTGFEELRRKLTDLPKIAAALSADIGKFIKDNKDGMPNEVSCELKLSLGQECKFWIIGLKGEQAVTLKFTWKQ